MPRETCARMNGRMALVLGLCLAAGVSGGCRTTPNPGSNVDDEVSSDTGNAGAFDGDASSRDVPLPLTCDAAVKRAVQCSERVIALRAAVTVAEQQTRSFGDLRDPELRLSYGEDYGDSTRMSSSYETDGASAAIPGYGVESAVSGANEISELASKSEDNSRAFRSSVRIFTPNPWERAAVTSQYKAELELALALQRQAEWDTARNVHGLFVELHFVREDLRVLEVQKELRRTTLKQIRDSLQQGSGTIQDVMDASRRYLAVISDTDRARRRLDALMSDLSELTRLTLKADDVDTSGVDIRPGTVKWDTLDADVLAEQALSVHPDIAVLVWKTVAADALYRQAKAAEIPWFRHIEAAFGTASQESANRSASYTTSYKNAGKTTYDYESTDDSDDSVEWRVDTAISLPVFSWMGHDRRVRLAERQMAQIQEDEAREKIRFRVRKALASISSLETTRNQYESDARPLLEEMDSVVEQSRTGAAVLSIDEAARLEEEVLNARRFRLEAQHDYNLSVANLSAILGQPLSRILQKR